MADHYALSSSSNGSQESRSSGAFSRRQSLRRPQRSEPADSSRVSTLSSNASAQSALWFSQWSQLSSLSSTATLRHNSDEAYTQQRPSEATMPSPENARQDYLGCTRCMESLSAPYLGFRVYLDTHELVSFMTNPPYAFDLPPTLERDVEELLKHVNALLNDCGGTVCVHCSLTCPVTWLDEVLDHRLRELMANPGTLYEDSLERLVVDERHVVYRVKPTADPCLSVLHFHSPLAHNQALVLPTQAQVQALAQRWCVRAPGDPEGENFSVGMTLAFHHLQPVQGLAPGSRIHFLSTEALSLGEDTSVNHLVNVWWEELGLPRYVSALCKQQGGGSVYLGVTEQVLPPSRAWVEVEGCRLDTIFPGCGKKVWVDAQEARRDQVTVHHLAKEEDVPWVQGSRTGIYLCHGVRLSQRDRASVRTALLRKVQSEMLWYPEYPDRDPVTVTFHPVTGAEAGQDLCVVEVQVRRFQGVAFEERRGPVAYWVKAVGLKHEVKPMTVEDLMSKLCTFANRYNPLRALQEESLA